MKNRSSIYISNLAHPVIVAIMVVGLLIGAPGMAKAQGVMRIAAVVNDEVISIFDVDNRARLVILSSGVRPDENNRRRFVQQILRTLIDERLRLQEASSKNVSVSQREIDREITGIAQRNNITPDQFIRQLTGNGIDPTTLRNQLEAGIGWRKLVSRQLRRQIDISEEEVDEQIESIKENLNKPQKRIQEIFLTIDSPEDELDVRQTALRLVDQARAGADFSRLARSFSQSQSAEKGGDLGWTTAGQLRTELDAAISTLSAGEVSDPVQTFSGLYILRVAEARSGQVNEGDTKVDIVQLVVPLPGNATAAQRQAAQDRLTGVINDVASCGAAETVAKENEGINASSAAGVRLGDMPENIRNVLLPLSVGQTSEPIVTDRAVLALTVCKRSAFGSKLPSRDDIRNRIGNERLDLLARRYMRDLRREAYIDIRL